MEARILRLQTETSTRQVGGCKLCFSVEHANFVYNAEINESQHIKQKIDLIEGYVYATGRVLVIFCSIKVILFLKAPGFFPLHFRNSFRQPQHGL